MQSYLNLRLCKITRRKISSHDEKDNTCQVQFRLVIIHVFIIGYLIFLSTPH